MSPIRTLLLASGRFRRQTTLKSLIFFVLLVCFPFDLAANTVLSGRVLDETGAGIAGANVQVNSTLTKSNPKCQTASDGSFRLVIEVDGKLQISASARGFAAVTQDIETGLAQSLQLDLVLGPAPLLQQMEVNGGLIAGTSIEMQKMAGAVEVLDAVTMKESRIFTAEEALRKISGLYARPEEGFGLRPNIGIRGMNPTRSSRVLLLEDGLPLAYAPYGDNASYYHPPIDRYEGVEVVKGSAQILYGPMTVGGVVNYVTPAIPEKRSGTLLLTGGNRDYMNLHTRYGGTWKGVGLLFDGSRKQGEGSRDNTRSGLTDLNLKAITTLGSRQTISWKANYYGEDSRVTYSGLRLDEYLAAPRGNVFRNDGFAGDRVGLSAQHSIAWTPNLLQTTNVYGSTFSRDWWRQSSNSSQRPNDSADPLCGGMANLFSTCGNEGRLRDYRSWGIEPKFRLSQTLLGQPNDFEFGFRYHNELQERVQQNGTTPLARTGTVVEDNQRRTWANSFYLQNRFHLGAKFVVTPGVRLEQVRYSRTNRLFNSGLGAFGKGKVNQFIPGIGLAFTPTSRVTVFAGVHRGFAPPRAEDIVNNSGGFVELDPELSWNYEAGVRARVSRNFSLDGTYFRIDYQNQVVPASLAGGVGSLLTSAGKTLHQGLEMNSRYDWRDIFGTGNTIFVRGVYTYLPVARYEGVRYSAVAGFANVLITGNRLPYASAHLANGTVGFRHRSGVNVQMEMTQTGRQFADDLNTINATPDGQRGALPGYVIWNGTLNVPLEKWNTSFFVTTKNMLDRLAIVDRARGILPNGPRLLQTGLRWEF